MADQQQGKGLIFLTGLWKAKSRQGNQYLQGRLGVGGKLMLFKYDKKKDSDPDWYAVLGEWQQSEQQPKGSGRFQQQDDDVPF